MNIGQAASEIGARQKRLRYYESIALQLKPSARSDAGYFTRQAILHALRFYQTWAGGWGFAEQIRELLSLWQTISAPAQKGIALAHVSDLNTRIAELTEMLPLSPTWHRANGDDKT
jgi:MerR family copper efflux transcriptional regulator